MRLIKFKTMTKIQVENNLQYHLKRRATIQRELDKARKILSNLKDEQEDNEASIRDMENCLEEKIYS